jgi:predicted HTH domain antitoxin
MSTIQIPDDVLQQAGIDEREALCELACRLFDTGKLSLFFAAKLAGLSRARLRTFCLQKRSRSIDLTMTI